MTSKRCSRDNKSGLSRPHDSTNPLCIRQATLDAMRALNGVAWETATGELHMQYNEMPNWIVLRKVDDLDKAHRAFASIVSPWFSQMGQINATVSYSRGTTVLTFLETNDDIRAAARDGFGQEYDSAR